MPYTLSDDKRKSFATSFLLDKMINRNAKISILLEGDDCHLEDLLTYMMAKGYVDIEGDRFYVPTTKGREELLQFKRRYLDFLKNFDVYCAVDLEAGEFAFSEYFDYEDEDLWDEFLEDERWEDLRVAVAQFKKIDPVEIVFMGFLNEGRINDKVSGWQFDLLLGSIWDEILEVCNSLLSVEDLGYEDEDGNLVSGESVIRDIIHQGSKLNLELWEEEAKQKVPPIPNGVQAEPIKVEVYHRYIDDPYYISPVWRRWDD